jgi:hypothetical protein
MHRPKENQMPTPQKIIDAVKSIGGSDEMARDLVEAVEAYVAEREADSKSRFKKIMDKAKGLCVEYVENEVLKNARKLKVYIEAKEREFADAAERNRRLDESEAVAQLRKIGAILNNGTEDVNVDAMRQLTATKKSQERLEKAFTSLKEENAKLSAASNRANTIAERAIASAKNYRSMLSRAGLLAGEGSPRRSAASGTVSEGVESRAERPVRMIGESRVRAERPVTSRPVVAGAGRAVQSSDPVVNQIAKNISTDL